VDKDKSEPEEAVNETSKQMASFVMMSIHWFRVSLIIIHLVLMTFTSAMRSLTISLSRRLLISVAHRRLVIFRHIILVSEDSHVICLLFLRIVSLSLSCLHEENNMLLRKLASRQLVLGFRVGSSNNIVATVADSR